MSASTGAGRCTRPRRVIGVTPSLVGTDSVMSRSAGSNGTSKRSSGSYGQYGRPASRSGSPGSSGLCGWDRNSSSRPCRHSVCPCCGSSSPRTAAYSSPTMRRQLVSSSSALIVAGPMSRPAQAQKCFHVTVGTAQRPNRFNRLPARSEARHSEESRRSGGGRLWERFDLGHPGSHLVVEPARQFQRADVVGSMDEDGRGTALGQPAGNCVEPGLPSRDRACRVVPADVADDGIGSEGPRPAGQAWFLPPRLPLGVAHRRAAEQDGGVEGHPFGADVTESPLELLLRPRVLEERAVPYLDAVAVPVRETAQETGESADVGGAEGRWQLDPEGV